MSFKDDFNWQAQYVPRVAAIIDELPLKLFTQAKIAPREVDLKQNGDLLLFPFGGMSIAMRLRRPKKGYLYAFGLQFTIRTLRDTGAETELSKIRRGLGDWFFYGHIEEGWSP
jgi:hypothetical protein